MRGAGLCCCQKKKNTKGKERDKDTNHPKNKNPPPPPKNQKKKEKKTKKKNTPPKTQPKTKKNRHANQRGAGWGKTKQFSSLASTPDLHVGRLVLFKGYRWFAQKKLPRTPSSTPERGAVFVRDQQKEPVTGVLGG